MANDTSIQSVRPIDPNERCGYAWGPAGVETTFCDDAFACGVCNLPPGGGGLKLKVWFTQPSLFVSSQFYFEKHFLFYI